MSQGTCNNHGLVDAVWKEVTSKKDGKAYKFWSCPRQEKDQFGNWVKCKVTMANTPNGLFNQSLDKSASQMDSSKKDELITRTAIAKSFIESNHVYGMDTVMEMEKYLAWIQGRAQTVTAPPLQEPDDSELPF